MQKETDAPTFGEHSSSVATYGEVETAATGLIAGKFCKRQANRASGDDLVERAGSLGMVNMMCSLIFRWRVCLPL